MRRIPRQQDEQADHDAEGRGAGDQAGDPGRARGRAAVVGLPVVELAPEQPGRGGR